MTKRNGRGRIYFNKLAPSVPDTVALSQAVEDRYVELCGTHRRVRGGELVLPAGLDADVIRWRQMQVRFKGGDFRNTEAELRSVRAVAEWTVAVNAEVRNQEPQKIAWR